MQAFHPLCARRAGLHMEMAEPAVPNGPLQLITYCPKHCKPQQGMSGEAAACANLVSEAPGCSQRHKLLG